MDCGVQVDAGKPLIIAEAYSKTLTPSASIRTRSKRLWTSGCTRMETNGRSGGHVQRLLAAGLSNANFL